jgi:hypothetical protein
MRRSFIHHIIQNKVDIVNVIILTFLAVVLVYEAFYMSGQPANMDGTVHITNIAIFHNALRDGDFPVRWTDGFANYGLPMGSFAQQMTSYLGGFLTFITNDPLVSFNYVYLAGTWLSLVVFYCWLRNHASSFPAMIGAFLFNFAPYRIINLYIRGALPEYFSSVFVALMLLSLYLLLVDRKIKGWLLLVLATAGLILTHPMNVITGAFLVGPYGTWLVFQTRNKIKGAVSVASAMLLGVLMTAYYTVPLLKEIQYFYYGSGSNRYTANSALGLDSIFDNQWYYFHEATNSILSRGHVMKVGSYEFLILLIGLLTIGISWFKLRSDNSSRLTYLSLFSLTGLAVLYFMSPQAVFLFEKIDLLSNIQFSWRLLSAFIFIPPIIATLLLQQVRFNVTRLILACAIVFLVVQNRFPQLYGKNYTIFPQNHYYFTVDNLHTTNMNTIWSERSTNYPIEVDKAAILSGEGEILAAEVSNSSRSYTIKAQGSVRMIDRTFYFPGWEVTSNGVRLPIEFQDEDYRGVITYELPEGLNQVELKFTDTNTVKIGNYLSLVAIFALGAIVALLFLRKERLTKFLI